MHALHRSLARPRWWGIRRCSTRWLENYQPATLSSPEEGRGDESMASIMQDIRYPWGFEVCILIRRVQVRSGTLDTITGDWTWHEPQLVTQPCGAPMTAVGADPREDAHQGVCPDCRDGHSVPNNQMVESVTEAAARAAATPIRQIYTGTWHRSDR